MRLLKWIVPLSLLLWALLIGGCALVSSPERPGYQAGRTTAVVWMATENIQPAQLHNACITGYRVLQAVYGHNEDLGAMDQAAEHAVDLFLEDSASDAQKQLVMNFYVMARNRLEREVTDRAGRIVVLANFTAGIQDALNDYRQPNA